MALKFTDASLAIVAALVRWHLPARALVRFKLVSKEWKAWCEENLEELAKVRRMTTPSRDWYFPISFNEEWREMLRSWCSVHHCGEEELLQEHRLPDFDFLPRWPGPDHLVVEDDLESSWWPARCYEVLAVSGGLFLFKYKQKHYVPYLMVVNPLRREWRSLPHGDACCEHLSTLGAFETCTSGKWTYIVADEEAPTYTVTVVTRNCFNVYRSDTDRWECTSKHANTRNYFPGGFLVHDINGFELPVSAIVNGRVFICHRGQHPGRPLPLQSHHFWNVETVPRDTLGYVYRIYAMGCGGTETAFTDVVVSYFRAVDCYIGGDEERIGAPKLVVCMSDLYVVASRCGAKMHVEGRTKVYLLRREFHLFKFQEGSTTFSRHVDYFNQCEIPDRLSLERFWGRRKLFSCTARSSGIWLAWENQLVQYNVASNVWRDDLYSGDSCWCEETSSGMAYTTRFHLKP